MIDYVRMRTVIFSGLSAYIGAPVIRGDQAAEAPHYPYMICNATTLASENRGTWQQHEDGIDRKLVRSIWSFTSLSDDYDESVSNAVKAREWLDHTGHVYLSDNGITVQSMTAINNRDNVLTVDYERKNGFDVVFYVYDEAGNPANSTDTGYIDSAEFVRQETDE